MTGLGGPENGPLPQALRELAAVRPRAEYSVVHGELGLDHVLVDSDGNPVIIAIEDLMYFDAEWEHVHMQIRLHDDRARTVGVDGLDEDRLALYMLTQRLPLTAGPLRLLDGDFPNRAFKQSIAEIPPKRGIDALSLCLALPRCRTCHRAPSLAFTREPSGLTDRSTSRLAELQQGESAAKKVLLYALSCCCRSGSGVYCGSQAVVAMWLPREAEAPERAVPVKLPHVEYEAPATVADAVGLLAEHQDDASVLAGGQSLIPLLALRLARPAVLVDINGLGELSGVSAADGQVTIGAVTREYLAEESEIVADAVPLLASALPLIGHEAIRSRGTIGGSLAHADPAAELPAVALALGAEFVVRSQAGERVIPAAGWFQGYLATARRPDEILTEVRFPAAAPDTGATFQEIARRHGDFAIVGLAASLTFADGAISDARLAFSGVADVPVRAAEAESLLVGEEPSAELFEEAARRATAGLDPPADLHGSSEYRKKIAATLVRRGLQAAVDSAYGRQ